MPNSIVILWACYFAGVLMVMSATIASMIDDYKNYHWFEKIVMPFVIIFLGLLWPLLVLIGLINS